MARTIGAAVLCALLLLGEGCLTGINNTASGSDLVINLDLGAAGAEIADTFYGIFFEDINYAADGGIYPELIRNRSFEWKTPDPSPKTEPLRGWTANYGGTGSGSVTAAAASPLNPTNPTYVTLNVTGAGYALANGGYAATQDIALKAGAAYRFLFYARRGTYAGSLRWVLKTASGSELSNAVQVTLDSASWKKYGPYTLTAAADGQASLVLTCESTGDFDLDFVSLMRTDTWGAGQAAWPHGGLRKDLVEALRDLKPGFIRFPGGCIVEGAYRHETTYRWKDTIGPPEERRENSNLWGYMMSYGMGFHEYFQLCEDLGAEPVPVLGAGILCQARVVSANEPDYTPGSAAFNTLIQDYLDLIEYATGSTSTTWGAKRAANGHPAPFNLKKIGIGNENWETKYWTNFAAIRAAVLQKYPDIKIITTTGPLASGAINDAAWSQINAFYKDAIVDEHYYMEPSWFLTNTRRYDSYPRNGTQIFVGEYAAHETNRGNTWYTALCEAAYMTALERNADIVKMASYAPLFARDGAFQWRPDMIWFDSNGITNLTPNYAIQKLFSTYKGARTVPSEKRIKETLLFQATSIDGEGKVIYTKLVNPFSKARTVDLHYVNGSLAGARAEALMLSGEQNARTVSTRTGALAISNNTVTVTLEPYSAGVVTIRE
ncbi:MAG: hypothetical protein LBR16_08680 [Treponema sp.]|jgi:alpha-L-arabinofuranosidase|nr:hypothetical protein [Treponema sp.]